MIRLTLSLIVFYVYIFCFLNIVFAEAVPIQIPQTQTQTQTEKRGLFSTMDSVKNQKVQITELQGALTLEQQNIETLSEFIDTLEQNYKKISNGESEILNSPLYLSGSINRETEISFIEAVQELMSGLPESLEAPLSFSQYQSQKEIIQENYILTLEENLLKKQRLETNISQFSQRLEDSQDELLRQEKLLTELYKTLARSVGTLVAIVLGIYLFSHFLQWLIKGRPHLLEDKKNVLINFVKWIANISIICIIAVYFFAELLSFLPFVAILGTAIGFALRDIISSFIAWFLIGHKDSVYKIGDVIEVEGDNVFGRVFKISPVVTTIQELGLSGPSGMYKSFPNKAIFEKSIKNISKINNWVYISVDFLLDKSSSIPKSKAVLLEAMNEVVSHEKYSSPFEARAPFKKYGIKEENIHPQIFLDIKPQGIFLRGKVFVYWPERHGIRSEIVEEFFERAQKDTAIDVKQVEIG